MTKQRQDAIEKRIRQIKEKLMGVGTMRPGSLTKQLQKRSTTHKVFEYWQLSYTHKMKARLTTSDRRWSLRRVLR